MEVHSCEECSYKTKLLFGMIYHVRRHRLNSEENLSSCEKPPELYSCPHCYFESDLSTVLKEHAISLHKNEETEEVEDYNYSTYDCETCNFQTFSVLVMLKHVTVGCVKKHVNNTHTGQEEKARFVCGHCHSYVTKKKCNLRAHIRLNHKSAELIKWHQCAQCSYKSKRKFNLQQHISKKHTDLSEMKWLECTHCPYKTKFNDNLNKHIIRIHLGQEGRTKFPCGQCSYVAKRKCHLRFHVMYKHTSVEMTEWHQCAHCSYKTKHKSYLLIHTYRKHSISSDLKRFEVDQCTKSKHESYLQKHKRDFGETKWFECDRCSFKSKYKESLKRHSTMHLGAEESAWFPCDQCSYVANQKALLNKHVVNKHTTREIVIKWHQCAQCPYKGKNNYSLRRHTNSVHSDPRDTKKFKCDHCPHKSKCRYDLKRHVIRMHLIHEEKAKKQ